MALAVLHDPSGRNPSLSPLSSSSPTPALSPALAREQLKVVVFDDDPTGSQTLHGCPLLLRWDAASLAAGLCHPSPFLFVLANTRALQPDAARRRIREICATLRPVLDQALAEGVIRRCWLVSRGDSTLRGHFPLEIEEIAAAFGPFAATLLVPAFLEGGRTTVDGVHRLAGRPVHESPFAHDRLFAYGTSYLPEWVAEKSGGRIPAAAVARLGLEDLEAGGERLSQRLLALAAGAQGHQLPDWPAGRLIAVDATTPSQLARLGEALRGLPSPEGQRPAGRFLFQSAASLLNGLAPLPPQRRDPAALAALRRRDPGGCPQPGLVLVGSHVPLADQQLAGLLAEPACAAVEVPVARVQRVLEGPLPDQLLASLEDDWLQQLEAALASGRTPVLHTSRGELACRHAAERRRLGRALAGAMARLVGRLAPRLGYVISKGGITSQTLLADGLALTGVELQGQLLPGVSLVLAPQGPGAGWGGCPGALGLPVVTLPGNLGDPDTLVRLWQRLEGSSPG
ncbi:MAG: four-carbon acid sugar kinase family protein [Cyanobium sp.]